MIAIEVKENCTGCYGCVNVCPTNSINMKNDCEGFWYPEVDETHCMDCSLCNKTCPVMNKVEITNDPLFFACYSKNQNIRLNSSSGGIFTLIAEQLIAKNGIAFGARFDKEYKVVHDCIDNVDELKQFRGSKYVQSRIGCTYKLVKKELEKGRHVLFSGTPCQIEGLKAFLKKEYINLFCVDFICHGVPSPKVWQKYINYRKSIAGEDVRGINFRRKDNGWKHFCLGILFENEKEYCMDHKKDLFMKSFLRNISLRPSCYSCKFKSLHRNSDITLADFWGIQNTYPDMDDDKGVSLVFINTTRGKTVFNEIKEHMVYKEVDIKKVLVFNINAVESVNLNSKRQHFFEMLDDLPFDKLTKRFCSDKARVKSKLKNMIKSIFIYTGLMRFINKSHRV